MKKILLVCLTLVLSLTCLVFTACGDNNAASTDLKIYYEIPNQEAVLVKTIKTGNDVEVLTDADLLEDDATWGYMIDKFKVMDETWNTKKNPKGTVYVKAVLMKKNLQINYVFNGGAVDTSKKPMKILNDNSGGYDVFTPINEINSSTIYDFNEKVVCSLDGHEFIGWAFADKEGNLMADDAGEILLATTLQDYLQDAKANNELAGNLYLVAQYEEVATPPAE